jgi:hypothetical protein
MFSISNNCNHYGSDILFSSVTRKRYMLEKYPSRTRGTAEYNPLYDAFQPITPPNFNQQLQERHRSVYEQPFTHYFNDEQRQYISPGRQNTGKQLRIKILI